MMHALAALAGVLTLAAILAPLSQRVAATSRARLVQVASLCAFLILVLGWFVAGRLLQAGLGLPAMAWGVVAAVGAVSFAVLKALSASMASAQRPPALPLLWRRRLAYGLAGGLLIAVAAVQIGRSQVGDLARWKGGGFGMFSTIEERFIRAEIRVGERSAPGVRWDRQAFRKRVKTLRKNPDPEALQKLARILAARRWVTVERLYGGETIEVRRMLAPGRALRGRSPDAVTLQSWDVVFEGGEVRPVLIREVTEQRAQKP